MKPIKEIIRGFFVEMEDEVGKTINTFYKKKDADEFYEEDMGQNIKLN